MPSEDPKFFFTAHSAWCPYKQSGNLTVKLIRPEIREITWEVITYDEGGNESGTEAAKEVVYGEIGIVRVKVKEVEEGGMVNIRIVRACDGYEETHSVEVKEGEAELRYAIQASRETLEGLGE
jgi:hypothetical protein